ncbi:ribonuclease H-like domain-containing protein [Flammula alnicola]|nr:ribonuclease H-like domain-containing protein [Flammula alnicola]
MVLPKNAEEPEVEVTQTLIRKNVMPAASFADVLENLSKNDDPHVHNLWARPAVPALDEERKSITFQKIDIRESNQESGHSEIHLFGVTKVGGATYDLQPSVSLQAQGRPFYPPPKDISEDDMEPLRDYLNTSLKSDTPVVTSIEMEDQSTASGGKPLAFLKISLSDHRQIRRYRDLFSAPELSYETTVPYFLRFMVDNEITAMAWLKIPTAKYDIVAPEKTRSWCQFEISVNVEDLLICDTVDNREKFAPLRILSFDIECNISKVDGQFSSARRDSVIQIGNMVSLYGQTVPFIRTIFTLGSCSPISGSQILSFEKESDMFTAWQKFFVEVDPDIVIGYNITQFDIPYLLNRARTLGLHDFPFLGRIKGYDGRLILDIFHHIRENHPGLPGEGAYKLNGVSAHFLGDKKEDIDYKQIPALQGGNADTRRDLAVYCLKDVYLPLLLLAKLKCFEKEVKEAKEAHVPYNVLRVWRPLKDVAKRCLEAIAQQYVVVDAT